MHVLRYMKQTSDLGITYTAGPQHLSDSLIAYTNTDWGGDQDQICSTPGNIVTLAGSAILWGSKLQMTTAQSTMEAECIAASFASKEILWLRQMLDELMPGTINKPTPILCDNQSAIAVAKNPAMHDKAKHIAMKYHSNIVFSHPAAASSLSLKNQLQVSLLLNATSL